MINRNDPHQMSIEEFKLDINDSVFPLAYKDQRRLWCIRDVYSQQDQQDEMYRTKTKRIEGRIVSVSKPHVRSNIRGRAGAAVEFGAKISAGIVVMAMPCQIESTGMRTTRAPIYLIRLKTIVNDSGVIRKW